MTEFEVDVTASKPVTVDAETVDGAERLAEQLVNDGSWTILESEVTAEKFDGEWVVKDD